MELTFEERREEAISKREAAVKPFANDPILSTTIPETVAGLIHDQFGMNIPTPHVSIPIIISVAWKEILKYIQEQQVDEFSMDVAGVSVEYVTDISESDKPTNIVPQLTHKKLGIFMKVENNSLIGSDISSALIEAYTAWRTVNLTENVTNLENKIFSNIFNEYNLHLGEPVTIFPILSCAYTVAVTIAKDTHTTVNFYNLFEIDVMDDDHILLNPLAGVKQNVKNDSKQ
jgi:hypothetical protein